MPFNSMKESFDNSLYGRLLLEDREMIDEYIPKMSFGEVNSFMKRLVEQYDVLEVNEEVDEILVFEKNSISNKIDICFNELSIDKKAKENRIPYDKITALLDEEFSGIKEKKNKSFLFFSIAIRKYFEEEYNKNIASIGWAPTNDMMERIRELYIELVKDKDEYVRKIINQKLPLKLYTYRNNQGKTYKKRMGIVIDRNILPATIRSGAGYSPNFKMDKKFISVELVNNDNIYTDISSFVKSGVYWSIENASIHGFDDRTGIIWFNGERVDDSNWKFPNGNIVRDSATAVVNVICTPDAFSKMSQRFNLDKKLKEIVCELEIAD